MKKRKLTVIVSVIAALMAVFSLFMIVSSLITRAKEQDAFDSLAAMVDREREETDPSDNVPKDPSQTDVNPDAKPSDDAPAMLREYVAVYEQNSDFYGWLRIDGTQVNYPVMFTPDDPEYYLHRAFDKSESHSGTPFLDSYCFEGCGNLLIYGHHMNNGTMFGSLPKYAEKSFWEEHKTIYFDTLYERGEYEIVAAFYGKALNEGESGFRYYLYTDLTSSEIFDEYISQVYDAALYDTGIKAEFGDELITLSTCSYHTDNGRFIVVARKIKD